MPFDELNILKAYLAENISILTKEECEDSILDMLVFFYLAGVEQSNNSLNTSIEANTDEMYSAIYKEYNGKNFTDRVNEYYDNADINGIFRVLDTDAHRAYNAGAYHTAKSAGAQTKTWLCMFRNSRDTHEYLDGTTVGIDEDFYSYTGAHAPYPGLFNDAYEDVNCQCEVIYSL